MYMHTDVLGTGPVRCPLRFTHHPAGAPKHKNTKHSPQASKAKTQKHKTHALRARLKHKNTKRQNTARGQHWVNTVCPPEDFIASIISRQGRLEYTLSCADPRG